MYNFEENVQDLLENRWYIKTKENGKTKRMICYSLDYKADGLDRILSTKIFCFKLLFLHMNCHVCNFEENIQDLLQIRWHLKTKENRKKKKKLTEGSVNG